MLAKITQTDQPNYCVCFSFVRVVRHVRERGGNNLRRTQLLNAQTSQPLAHVDSLVKGVTINNASAETASKSITSTVGVVDELLGELVNRVLLDLILTLNGNNGRLGTLSDDSHTLPLGVDLGQVGERLGDLLDIRQTKPMALRVRSRLALITNDIIPIRRRGIERLLEELADERGGQAQDERLVLLGRLLSQLLDRGGADGEVVPADVVGLCVLDESPDVWALEVLEVVVVGGAELGDHGAVVARDDDAAAAGGDLGVYAVLDPEADLLDGIAEDGGVLVVAGAAEVDDRVGCEDVLGSAGGVLSGAAGDELGVVVVEEVLVDGEVLLLGEDGVVGLEAVFFEEGLVAKGLDIWGG